MATRGPITLAHVAEAAGRLRVPNLEALGLGHLGAIAGVRRTAQPDGCFGKMAALSKGKDSTTGHWEMTGVVLEKPFPTYPNGFPSAGRRSVTVRLPEPPLFVKWAGNISRPARRCMTADHGNDPTRPGTDHTREYVPLLVYGARVARGVNLGTRKSFADLGQTIAEALGSTRLAWGESFLHIAMQS